MMERPSVHPHDRLDMMSLLVGIADTGSLTKACKALNLSSPVASRMLRRFEDMVGAELVHRSTRGLTLTEAGAATAETARDMLAHWSTLVEDLLRSENELRGTIRIATPISLGQVLFPRVFAAFMKRHPGVAISCKLTDEHLDLPSNSLDLQIRAGPVQQDSMVVRDLWAVRRSIVVRADGCEAKHPDELAAYPAIRPVKFVPLAITLTHAQEGVTTLRLSSVFDVDNLYSAITMVREGVGYSILPCFATQPLVTSGELRELCPGWAPPLVQLSVAYLPSQIRSRRVEALIAFIRKELTHTEGLGLAFLGQEGALNTVAIYGAPRPTDPPRSASAEQRP